MDRTSDKLAFGPFCLDASQGRLVLRDDDRTVPLTPKAFDVLRFLAERPGKLVTKDELLSALWPDVIVGDSSIKTAVREVRKALDDAADAPRYIATVHRRGYRFVAPLLPVRQTSPAAPPPPLAAWRTSAAAATTPAATPPPPAHPTLVGRDRELRRLVQHLALAARGQRQCVLVTGSPGSGKSALVEQFLRRVGGAAEEVEPPLVLVGHCFEQFGGAEPYLPIWEAVGRAAKEWPQSQLAQLVARHAPEPAAPAAAGSSSPPVVLAGAAAAPNPPPAPQPPQPQSSSDETGDAQAALAPRPLRELAEAIESLAAAAPVVLVLEDAHWVDHSTLDLLNALARRREPAQLMMVVTYRPAEAHAGDHPLGGVVRELLTARLAEQLPLGGLDEPAVAQYVAARFPRGRFPPDFAQRLHRRTGGEPLFLVHLLDDLIERGILTDAGAGQWRLAPEVSNDWTAAVETHVPSTVRAMIEAQLERLEGDEQRVLEAAAVAGVDCSAAAVAAALGEADVVAVESTCDDLARRHRFLTTRGAVDWPDGSVSSGYRFVHELYHNVVYQRLGVARRAQLHRALGLRLEGAWGERAAGEAAGALALHFELGHDWPRAVTYLRAAADGAARHYAHREVIQYLRRALAALEHLPPARRGKLELPLRAALGVNLRTVKGSADPEVAEVFARAEALCGLGSSDAAAPPPPSRDVREVFPILWGIWVFHKVRSDLRRAEELARKLFELAARAGNAALMMQAHQAMCVTALCQGRFGAAVEQMEQAAAIYDPEHHPANTHSYGQDPGVSTQAFGAVALQRLGRGDEALAASERALELARGAGQPSTRAISLHFAAMLHQLRGDAAATARHARAELELATTEGFSFWRAGAMVFTGWSDAARGDAAGIDRIRQGLAAWLATGSRTYHPYYLGLLADALLRHDRAAEARDVIAEALAAADSLQEGLYEAELRRLQAEAAAAQK